MNFECLECAQQFDADGPISGESVHCPFCGSNVQIPPPPSKSFDPTMAMDMPASGLTIADFIKREGLEGGIELERSPEEERPKSGTRYQLGPVVAQGGMGSILNAHDLNVRRKVAMKVLLNPKTADRERIQRFIQEAQITGQLQHPSIVPLHELGVDANGSVFYTMKFVEGETLHQVLQRIRSGDQEAIASWSLNKLLNVFQRVCDAIAFAHSKRVIHRDLKPENIMIGEYGEVLVLDWGLAKVVDGSSVSSSGCLHKTVETDSMEIKSGVARTLDGQIMGTPGFMSPEQAAGLITEIDKRTDIYALGAILYSILTLHPPVDERDIHVLLRRVANGDIEHPEVLTRDCPMVHCPSARVPKALAAIAMRALATKADARFQTVEDLQSDIEAWQGGFLTSVEDANLGKHLKLFLRRHRAASLTGMALGGLLITAIIVYSWINLQERHRAENALSDYQSSQAALLQQQREATPSMIASAKTMANQGSIKEAEDILRSAIRYDESQVEASLLLALLMLSEDKLEVAREVCTAGLDANPGHGDLTTVMVTTNEIIEGKNTAYGSVVEISERIGVPLLSAKFISEAKEKLKLYREHIEKFWPGWGDKLKLENGGDFAFEALQTSGLPYADLTPLRGIPLNRAILRAPLLSDLSPLKDIPLEHLKIEGPNIEDLSSVKGMTLQSFSCIGTKVSDLSPLAGMPLESLDCKNTKVSDLNPLAGMPLKSLNLQNTNVHDLSPLEDMKLTWLSVRESRPGMGKISDLTPLTGMPLEYLDLWGARVTNLEPLKGMPLEILDISYTVVSDLSALEGMSITELQMIGAPVTDLQPLQSLPLKKLITARAGSTFHCRFSDLSPLEGMNLRVLVFDPTRVSTGLEVIRSMSSLTQIGSDVGNKQLLPPEEFWRRYDEGEYK